jgi:hypothetical protein
MPRSGKPGDARAPEAPPPASGAEAASQPLAAVLRCDFCGQTAPVVRRVALDRDYERLQTPHAVRYACSRCSDEKEQERLGLRRG